MSDIVWNAAKADYEFSAKWWKAVSGETQPAWDNLPSDVKVFRVNRVAIPVQFVCGEKDAEITALKAEVERLRGALESAEGNFYNMANAIDDADYRGTIPGLDDIVVGHFEKYHKGHVEWLVKYAEEARAALINKEKTDEA